MAKIILVDGPSRAGKGTLISQLLSTKPELRLVALRDKRPSSIDDMSSFYAGCAHGYRAFLDSAKDDDVFIFDRSMFTNLVYADVWHQPIGYDRRMPFDMIMPHKVLAIFIDAAYTDYIARGPKDSWVYTLEQYQLTRDLFSSLANQLRPYVEELKFFGSGTDPLDILIRTIELYERL